MRMTGLGVSPGIGVGKALVLKRGTRDLRFRVPAWLVERELERLDTARARAREQIEQIKARIATTAGAEHAYLFDAQLLMLDDAMLVGRAADTIRTERLNAESALQRALEHISGVLRPGPRSVSARAQGRCRRRRRAADDEPARGRRSDRPLPRPRRAAGARRARRDAVDHRAARLAAAGRARDRCRELDEPHRDPGALAAGAGGCRPAQRQRPRRAGHGRRRRRHDGRGHRRSRSPRRWSRSRRASGGGRPTSSRSTSTATSRPSRKTASRSGSRPTSRPPTMRRAQRARSGGHRVVPIRVPARGRRTRRRWPKKRSIAPIAGWSRVPARMRVTIRTFDVSETAAADRACRHRGHALAARHARHPPQPGDRRDLPGAAARAACAPRRTGRCASCFRSSPASRSCAPHARRSPGQRRRCAPVASASRTSRSA